MISLFGVVTKTHQKSQHGKAITEKTKVIQNNSGFLKMAVKQYRNSRLIRDSNPNTGR